MFLLNIINFLRGYVVILVEGFFTERFLNICARRNIYIWNVKRTANNKMFACVSIKGFKLLPSIAYKSKSVVTIYQKKGLPFLLEKYKKRTVFLLGIFIFFCFIFSLTLFLWDIKITGNNAIQTDEILGILNNEGLKIGMLKWNIDDEEVKTKVMLENDKIAWIGINLKGTTAYVEIKEAIPKPEIIDKNKPINIVATKDALVNSVIVRNGKVMVKKGDVVTAGEILISGIIESETAGLRYAHANGDVNGTVWYEKSMPLDSKKEIRTPTGKKKYKNYLNILGFKIKLFFDDKIQFQDYDRISEIKKFTFGKGYVLPFSLHYDAYNEVNVTYEDLSQEEIIKKLQNELDKEVSGRLLLDKKVEISENEVKVIYECVESITKEVEILND